MKNVSGENLSCNDILYNLIKLFEFCFKSCPHIAQCLYEDYYQFWTEFRDVACSSSKENEESC